MLASLGVRPEPLRFVVKEVVDALNLGIVIAERDLKGVRVRHLMIVVSAREEIKIVRPSEIAIDYPGLDSIARPCLPLSPEEIVMPIEHELVRLMLRPRGQMYGLPVQVVVAAAVGVVVL